MKTALLRLSKITFIIILYLATNQVFAQDPAVGTLSKDELKLQKLELKIK